MNSNCKKYCNLGLVLVLLAVACSIVSCTRRTVNRDVGGATGAVVGGGIGAAVGDRHGKAGAGAIIGGATGAVVGGAIGAERDREARYGQGDDEEIVLLRQRQELERQRHEAEDLKRQKHYDEKLRAYHEEHAGD